MELVKKMQEIVKGCDSITSDLTVLNSAEEIEECIEENNLKKNFAGDVGDGYSGEDCRLYVNDEGTKAVKGVFERD